jgi:hypothetical protein
MMNKAGNGIRTLTSALVNRDLSLAVGRYRHPPRSPVSPLLLPLIVHISIVADLN